MTCTIGGSSEIPPGEWRRRLIAGAATMGVEIAEQHAQLCSRLASQVASENRKYNLSSCSSPDEMLEDLFLDALAMVPAMRELGGNAATRLTLMDVGSGAGFPGIVLAIVCPLKRAVLLEARRKRAVFLTTVASELGLDHVTVREGRAERVGRDPACREVFDFVTARAVADLPALVELTLPFLRVGGWLLAPKGPDVRQEIEHSSRALKELGGRLLRADAYDLPSGKRGTLILVEKILPTPERYPRRDGIPAKRPLLP
ncbi:MAG: 16S rRNA (guanine(527)-N(7))-methyltransferase RsmG [bacterium]